VIKFHGISMPEGAALSWPLSDIVIRRKNGFDFRCRVRGCSLLDQRPVSAQLGHPAGSRRTTAIHVRRDKAALFQWVRGPPGDPLQPEAPGAGMEATKCLKPSDNGHDFGDRASVQAAT